MLTRKMESQETLDWERKRRIIFIFYLLTWYSMGLEISMLSSSLLFYIKGTIKPVNPDLFYGLIYGGRYFIALFFCVPFTRWFDKTRKLKFTSILVTAITVIGFIFYLLPFSIYLPLFGTILCGSNYILRAVLNSQLFRYYDDADIPSCFAMATFAYGVGDISGPPILMLSANLETWVGKLHIVYGNFQAIIMLLISMIRLIMSVGFIHDIVEKTKRVKELNNEQNEILLSTKKDEKETLNIDSYIILTLQFCSVAFGTNFILAVPPYIIESLGYGKFATTLFYLGGSSFIIIISIIAKTMKLNSFGVYLFGLASLTSILICYLFIAILTLVKGIPEALKITFLFLLTFIYGFLYVGEISFVPITLGHITPPSQQSSIEGIRMTAKLLGAFLGSIITPYAFKYLIYIFPLFMIVITFFMFAIVLRKETLLVRNY